MFCIGCWRQIEVKTSIVEVYGKGILEAYHDIRLFDLDLKIAFVYMHVYLYAFLKLLKGLESIENHLVYGLDYETTKVNRWKKIRQMIRIE